MVWGNVYFCCRYMFSGYLFVFDPWYRPHSSGRKLRILQPPPGMPLVLQLQHSGLGLGLYIAKSLVYLAGILILLSNFVIFFLKNQVITQTHIFIPDFP